MKKKLIVICLVNLFLFFVSPIYSGAEEQSDNSDRTEQIQKILDQNQADLDGLYNYIDKTKLDVELMNQLNPTEYVKSYIKNGEGNLSVNTVLKAVVSLVFKEVGSVLALAFSIITIGILGTLIKNLQDAFSSKGIGEVAFYACYVILIMVLSKSFLISISVAKEVINGISDFMSALLPVLISMVTLSGGVVESTTLDPIVMSAVLFVPKLYTNLIIPLVLIGFVLQFANNLSSEHKISNLCGLIKKTTLWFQGIVVTVFIALLTIRGITGSTIDAVTLKTTKFAVDNFIPIVGKSFSDAIASVAAYSLIIKNALTAVGLIVIILMILYPIVKIILMGFIYKLSAALLEPISDKRITACIQAAGDAMTILLSCVLSVSLLFFVFLGIMSMAGKFIVGA